MEIKAEPSARYLESVAGYRVELTRLRLRSPQIVDAVVLGDAESELIVVRLGKPHLITLPNRAVLDAANFRGRLDTDVVGLLPLKIPEDVLGSTVVVLSDRNREVNLRVRLRGSRDQARCLLPVYQIGSLYFVISTVYPHQGADQKAEEREPSAYHLSLPRNKVCSDIGLKNY